MLVEKKNVKNIEEYWKRLSANLSFLNHSLQRKSEYGSFASERGIQHIVLFTAINIAREGNLSINIVSALCQAVSLCFPTRGFAELTVIKELIKNNNMAIELETLELDIIEYAIYESGSTVTPELDELLHKYYSNDESVPEVNLVRFLQKYLNLNRKLLFGCSISDSGQIVDEIMKRAMEEYADSYRLLPEPIIQPIPESVKEEIEHNIFTYIDFHDDICVGIYEAVIY